MSAAAAAALNVPYELADVDATRTREGVRSAACATPPLDNVAKTTAAAAVTPTALPRPIAKPDIKEDSASSFYRSASTKTSHTGRLGRWLVTVSSSFVMFKRPGCHIK